MNLIPILYNTDAVLQNNRERKRLTDCWDSTGKPAMCWYIRPLEDKYEFGPWETVEEVEPLVKVEWHQGFPFNTKLQKIDGKYPPVGCVATAVSQIMSYHRYPEYDWDRIIANNYDPYSAEILSTLHRDLGKPENLDMSYGPRSSGARSKNVPRTLRAYGYQSSHLYNYDFKTIKSELFANRPVYISAYSLKHVKRKPRFLWWGVKIETKYTGGHAWVLDGYKRIRRKVSKVNQLTDEAIEMTYQTKELVHCNLGWGGPNNGYYLSKAFDTNREPEMKRSGTENGTHESYGELGNFQFEHEIITGIER